MIDFSSLNDIARRVTEGEFTLFMHMWRGASGSETVRVALEKGSAYGRFHMKVEGTGETPAKAFEAALRQFPPQPFDGVSRWDTLRIAAEDGQFTETSAND